MEIYPAPQIIISHPVYPGDKVTGSVQAAGYDDYVVNFTDHTRGWHFSETKADPGGSNSSAEVVQEAPLSAARLQMFPLANFGSTNFSDVKISGSAFAMTMINGRGHVKASVTGSQKNFTVHFVSAS